jgi:hypothetical protein
LNASSPLSNALAEMSSFDMAAHIHDDINPDFGSRSPKAWITITKGLRDK